MCSFDLRRTLLSGRWLLHSTEHPCARAAGLGTNIMRKCARVAGGDMHATRNLALYDIYATCDAARNPATTRTSTLCRPCEISSRGWEWIRPATVRVFVVWLESFSMYPECSLKVYTIILPLHLLVPILRVYKRHCTTLIAHSGYNTRNTHSY